MLFQDQFGLITFDEQIRRRLWVRPRMGKPHVVHCLDSYARGSGDAAAAPGELTAAIAAQLRRTSLVPVISDFLFADAPRFIEDLARLNAAHDVFLLLVDVRFAFAMPDSSAGWLEMHDIETGRTRVLSRPSGNSKPSGATVSKPTESFDIGIIVVMVTLTTPGTARARSAT